MYIYLVIIFLLLNVLFAHRFVPTYHSQADVRVNLSKNSLIAEIFLYKTISFSTCFLFDYFVYDRVADNYLERVFQFSP